MKFWLTGLFCVVALGTAAFAETRVEVKSPAARLLARADASADVVGQAKTGDILFVQESSGDWLAVSAPETVEVWISKDFVERNKVAANSVQVRSGPGIRHDLMGVLNRGTRVMPLGEQGDWARISAPSTLRVWVSRHDVKDVADVTAPIRKVEAPTVAPSQPGKPVESKPAPVAATPAPQKSVAPALAPAAHAPATVIPADIKPSRPISPAPARAVQAPAATPPPAVAQAPRERVQATSPQVAPSGSAPAARPAAKEPRGRPSLRQDWVDELDLVPLPDQGQAIRVQGELRNAPLCGYAPYRLIRRNDKGVGAVTLCNVKGDSTALRSLIGQQVVIRGYKYWVRASELPVVVVGDITPTTAR